MYIYSECHMKSLKHTRVLCYFKKKISFFYLINKYLLWGLDILNLVYLCPLDGKT